MRPVTPRENQLLDRIVRRIDRRAKFEASAREDGDIDLRLASGRLKTNTQLSATSLEASADDVMEFEALRRKIKRVSDRMRVAPPPPKTPRARMQKELAFTPRSGGRARR